MNKLLKSNLFIDTSDNKKTIVVLNINGRDFKKEKESGKNKNQMVLFLLDEILNENNLTLLDVHSVEVDIGPGSFTGLRVGLAIGNALSYLMNIKVNNMNIGAIVDAQY